MNAALNGEIDGGTQIAAAEVAPTRVVQPSPAATKDLRRVTPAPAPVLVSNRPVTSAPSVTPAVHSSQNGNGPIELRPRLLWQGGATPSQAQPAKVIKASPSGQSAYLPSTNSPDAFGALFKSSDNKPLAFQIRQTILIGKDVPHGEAFEFVEKFSRYGSVKLSSKADQKSRYSSVKLETYLPFALKVVRRTAPNAIVLSQD